MVFTRLTCLNVNVIHILLAFSCIFIRLVVSKYQMPGFNCANAYLHQKIIRQTKLLQQKYHTVHLTRPPQDVSFNKWSVGSMSMPAFLPVTPCYTFMPQLKCNKSLFFPHSPQIVCNKTRRCHFFPLISVLQNKQGFARTHFNIYMITFCGSASTSCCCCALYVTQRHILSPLQHKMNATLFSFLIGWFHVAVVRATI